jgi:hypothetical protein
MKDYEKPKIEVCQTGSEGVYAASGETTAGVKCDSIYMNGVWQKQNSSPWPAGETLSYKQQFGCLGCPANTDNGCGLQTHYVDSGYAGSYETDNGNRKPSWEKKGYGPDDPVTDFNM